MPRAPVEKAAANDSLLSFLSSITQYHNLKPEKRSIFGRFSALALAIRHFNPEIKGLAADTTRDRYNSYGELRLGRLTFWAKFALHRFAFQKVQTHYAYNAYLARFYGPLLFIFAFFSVVLSAMQVSMTVNPPNNNVKDPTGWDVLAGVCRWFSILAIILPSVALVTLLTTFLYMIGRVTTFALRHLRKNRAGSCGDSNEREA